MHQLDSTLVVSTDRRFLSHPSPDEKILSILGVDPVWTNFLRVIDSQDNLCLVHYLTTQLAVDDATIDETPLRHIGHVRGTIIDTNASEIVCKSLPYTPEVIVDDWTRIREFIPAATAATTTTTNDTITSPAIIASASATTDTSTIPFYDTCEGTIVRYYWWKPENAWKLSTHRKINASASHWNGPTFGDVFAELKSFDDNDPHLDKDLCYIFLLSHPKNRLIYKVPSGQIMLVAAYKRSSNILITNVSSIHRLPGVMVPQRRIFLTLNHLVDAVADTEGTEPHTFASSGIIAILGSAMNPKPVKFISEKYHYMLSCRGNEPNIRMRYINLRGYPNEALRLVNIYSDDPEYQIIFDNVEKELEQLAQYLHALYINRYVFKDFSPLAKEEFVTIQRCHVWHSEHRTANIVTIQYMRKYLYTIPPRYIHAMLYHQQQRNRRQAQMREQMRATESAEAQAQSTKPEAQAQVTKPEAQAQATNPEAQAQAQSTKPEAQATNN